MYIDIHFGACIKWSPNWEGKIVLEQHIYIEDKKDIYNIVLRKFQTK